MITVVGLGFVGLTTALGFCSQGFKVFGLEKDPARAATLRAGELPFLEPHLDAALTEYLDRDFFITSDPSEALEKSNAVFFCVGTPCDQQGYADLSHLTAAVEDVMAARDSERFLALVIKSTVPPGTADQVIRPLLEEHGLALGKQVGLSSNPEFLREGSAWEDFVHPDRVVIGTGDEATADLLSRLYEPFGAPIHLTSLNTAEFIKYLSNCLLATMISFSNEMSMLAHAVGGIDISKSFKVLHQDRRWRGDPAGMASYVYPGCGFGGYCLPKDATAMCARAKSLGQPAAILENVLKINQNIKEFLVDLATRGLSPQSRIALLGLSFKPGSDDVRDSPAVEVIRLLAARGYANVVGYDPVANQAFRQTHDLDLELASSLGEAIEGCQAVMILTAWPEFVENRGMYEGKQIFDFRYCLPS